MPGFMVPIFPKTCVSQAAWSCLHGSELADCAGRKEAEPPTTMIETNKSTKSRRIIVCPPFAGNVAVSTRYSVLMGQRIHPAVTRRLLVYCFMPTATDLSANLNHRGEV